MIQEVGKVQKGPLRSTTYWWQLTLLVDTSKGLSQIQIRTFCQVQLKPAPSKDHIHWSLFWVRKKWKSKKNFGPKKCLWSEKFFGYKKNFWYKKFLVWKNCASKKFWMQKSLSEKKILGQKKYWVQKIFGSWVWF